MSISLEVTVIKVCLPHHACLSTQLCSVNLVVCSCRGLLVQAEGLPIVPLRIASKKLNCNSFVEVQYGDEKCVAS